ncbi:MAG: hypothetical protein RKE49_08510 [Oceanicaulis sp.]
MTPAIAALLATTLAHQPAAPGAPETYAQRVALLAADEACELFSPAERALLAALAARSRDDAARAGDAPSDLDRFERRHGGAPESCDEDFAGAMRHRDHTLALSETHEIAFPGLHQDWVSERRHRSAPPWRVRQTARSRPAMLGVHAGEEGDVLALALRTASSPAFAVMVVRDPARQAEPLDFTAGGLLPAPYDDALSAWGAASGAERRIAASGRLDPDIAARLAPASGETALGYAFPDQAIDALRALAPRDGVRIELVGARGDVIDTLWFEAGMFNAALAVQALPLPEPDPTQTIASR